VQTWSRPYCNQETVNRSRCEDAAQRDYPLRDVFNALRYIAKTSSQWRFLPNDLPPWEAVYQQMRRWMEARCFETMVEDLRILLREFAGRKGQPMAMILDSRTLQSTPESGARGGYDGAKRRRGSKDHAAVDALGVCWLCMLLRPMSRIARSWRNWLTRCRRLAVRASNWHMSIKDIPARTRRRQPEALRAAVGGQTFRSQARIRAVAAPLGGGA